MIAVTHGVGGFAELARHAADTLHNRTGLPVLILGDADLARWGLPDAMYLPLRLFDATDEQDVFYFDPEMVCLRSWDPIAFRDTSAIVAVQEQAETSVMHDATAVGLPAFESLNAKFFIINRDNHHRWLQAAEAFVLANPNTGVTSQSALNWAQKHLGIPVRFLDRRYNWGQFGAGPLCYCVPVVMAHMLQPGNRELSMAYYGGHYKLPSTEQVEIDDESMDHLSGIPFDYITPDDHATRLFLREGGTIEVESKCTGMKYWFVQRRDGQRVLTFASQTHVLHELFEQGSGAWASERYLRPATNPELLASHQVSHQSRFIYERVGFDKRAIELLPDGTIGEGSARCEKTWSIVQEFDGTVSLVLSGERSITCKLTCDTRHGIWYGRWIIAERMPVTLRPYRPSPEEPDERRVTAARIPDRALPPGTNVTADNVIGMPSTPQSDDDSPLTICDRGTSFNLCHGTWIYRRVGHDSRRMEFCTNGTIGHGSAACERYWRLTRRREEMSLEILGADGLTCVLWQHTPTQWRGTWVIHERMPVQLLRDGEESL